MRNTRKDALMIGALLLAPLAISGCGTSQQAGGKNIQDVQTGTTGLEVEFLKNAPPKIVFEKTLFPVMLRVKNTGTYPIAEKKAILSLGVERDYISSINVEEGGRISRNNDNEAMFTLEGKTPLNPKGDEEVITYTVEAGKIDPQSESHPSTIIASLCYPYETKLAASVCIDPDPNNVRPIRKSCTVQDLSYSSGQGAPVAITKVEIQVLPTASEAVKPQFLISIENKGKGEVMKFSAADAACRRTGGALTYREFNAVEMHATLSGQDLECSLRNEAVADESNPNPDAQEFARLSSGKGVVRCSYPDDAPAIGKAAESYTAPFTITLSYGYTQSLTTDYAIKKR